MLPNFFSSAFQYLSQVWIADRLGANANLDWTLDTGHHWPWANSIWSLVKHSPAMTKGVVAYFIVNIYRLFFNIISIYTHFSKLLSSQITTSMCITCLNAPQSSKQRYHRQRVPKFDYARVLKTWKTDAAHGASLPTLEIRSLGLWSPFTGRTFFFFVLCTRKFLSCWNSQENVDLNTTVMTSD